MYYENCFKDNKNNLKKTWDTINKILGRTSINTPIDKIKNNDLLITNKFDMAEEFNDFFANIGNNLASTIPTCHSKFTDFLTDSTPSSLFLSPTNSSEID